MKEKVRIGPGLEAGFGRPTSCHIEERKRQGSPGAASLGSRLAALVRSFACGLRTTNRRLVFSEGVAEAANGLNQASLAALFQLAAEAFHRHIDEVGLTAEAVSPDLLAEL